jgi:hypothetical protein
MMLGLQLMTAYLAEKAARAAPWCESSIPKTACLLLLLLLLLSCRQVGIKSLEPVGVFLPGGWMLYSSVICLVKM